MTEGKREREREKSLTPPLSLTDRNGYLYYKPNDTSISLSQSKIELTHLKRVIEVVGPSNTKLVNSFNLKRVGIEQTHPVFMDTHEVE